MKRLSLALCAVILGCDPLLGGRCADGWVRAPGACDAGAAVDATVVPDATTVPDDAAADPDVPPWIDDSATGCGAPRVVCDGVCVDPRSDPSNCGTCGVRCATGICNGSVCRNPRAGHLVLIGHDYETTRPDQDRVVGNAVFLSGAAAPRVATCVLGATPASVTHVRAAVQRVAGPRTWPETVLETADALRAALSVDAAEVVLIHHQPGATDEGMRDLARSIAPAAAGFVRAGGVVVVLDGEGSAGGTWPLAAATDLVRVTGHAVATGTTATVVNGADAVAIGLPLQYRAERGSVAFLGTDDDGVVLRVGGRPLVLHRVTFGR